MPYPGFQAIILCGPGVSLNTFTANPEDFPKALVPIANRPMVWYPLDLCYRMGITSKYRLFIYFVLVPSIMQDSRAMTELPWLSMQLRLRRRVRPQKLIASASRRNKDHSTIAD